MKMVAYYMVQKLFKDAKWNFTSHSTLQSFAMATKKGIRNFLGG